MFRSAAARCTRLLHSSIVTRTFTSLPIIDVGPLVDPAAPRESVTAVAQQLHKACREVGFFYIQNHGVPQHVTEGVLQQAHKWFALPAEVKASLLLSPASHYRGYQPLGINVTRHESGFVQDWHEALDLFREEDAAAVKAAGRPPSVLHGPNLWPDQLPDFSTALRAYIDACLTLGEQLLRGIALGLGLPEAYFGRHLAGPAGSYWVARVIHYPPLQQVGQQQAAAAAGGEVGREVQLSCGEHCDYGLLTLVNQDPHVTALQVKNASGQWVDAPPLPGTFVCNIGDMFQVVTNGMYKATLHRVLNTARGTPRVSAPFFYEPCFEAVLAPAPQLCRGQPPLFQPIRYGSHLESKVLSNFEL
uniref:Fe2OG dioxygenase domain-containing protein n=1 Tax=Tetradesmus obliquus TaxID=3088 RepID=A0A383VMR0_TETOB|eukprot:jgi/Sobl393_1/15056/SZX66805.1